MYLIIWEDSQLYQTAELTDELTDAADDGICDIIAITADGLQFRQYAGGEFHDLHTRTDAK